jgi:hypothetical protein
MGRWRDGGLDRVTVLPWPAGVLAGAFAWFAIRHGLGVYFANVDSAFLRDLAQQAAAGAFAPHAWAALGVCWAGAALSFVGEHRRRARLAAQERLDRDVARRKAALVTRADCPSCGAVRVFRAHRRTGEAFWGCSAFPACEETAPLV